MVFNLIFYYFGWHYTKAYRDIFSLWGNFLNFFYNFFSIRILLSTLFSPFKRMGEERKRAFDFEDMFSVAIVNTIMRVVGFIVKSTIIITGAVAIIAVLILGLVSLIAWTLAPVLLIGIFALGVKLII